MNPFHQDLTGLAAGVGRGESSAARQFRHEIEPQLIRIVRHVLRGGRGPVPLTRRILAVAADVRSVEGLAIDRNVHSLARAVASRLCDVAVNRLRPEPTGERAGRETVRC